MIVIGIMGYYARGSLRSHALSQFAILRDSLLHRGTAPRQTLSQVRAGEHVTQLSEQGLRGKKFNAAFGGYTDELVGLPAP